MRVTVAVDSFKGSLTSLQAGEAVRRGILSACPAAEVAVCPVADGGEGTVASLCAALGGRMQTVRVSGPLGQPVEASYAWVEHTGTAVIEMAAAAGLTLLSPSQRDPLHATTYGVGEMIADALSRGCRRFLIGIGGSATNDGGAGMLQALGFDLADADGHPIPRGAAGLEKLCLVGGGRALPALADCTFRVACDVTVPLCGPAGCSAVFGPQKGADAALTDRLDSLLARFAVLVRESFPQVDPTAPGAGAAGGLGFAFQLLPHAVLEPGFSIVAEETGLDACICCSDFAVTGEGRLDAQTVLGKVPAGVAALAGQYGVPVLAFGGSVGDDADICNRQGIDAMFPILRVPLSLERAMEPAVASANLQAAAEQVFRLIACLRPDLSAD